MYVILVSDCHYAGSFTEIPLYTIGPFNTIEEARQYVKDHDLESKPNKLRRQECTILDLKEK